MGKKGDEVRLENPIFEGNGYSEMAVSGDTFEDEEEENVSCIWGAPGCSVLALVVVGALALVIAQVIAAHGSAVTCGGASKAGFDCAAEETRTLQKLAATECADTGCLSADCCEEPKVHHKPTCGNHFNHAGVAQNTFDCSAESTDTQTKAATTQCAGDVCTASECCEAPPQG